MEVILLKDIKKVGRKHEIVSVSAGYAQNVLLPQKSAIPATPQNKARFQKEQGSVAEKKAFNKSLLLKNIEAVSGSQISMAVSANDAGKLFKAIHTKDIVNALEKELKVTLPESALVFESIKHIGDYTIEVTGGNKKTTFTVNVVKA
ncbi:MAG: 50S ribosomal protein L9 [Patescibacteria group bacterium UBA2163]